MLLNCHDNTAPATGPDATVVPPPYFDPQQNEPLYSSIEQQARSTSATYPDEKQQLRQAMNEEREQDELPDQPVASTSKGGHSLSVRTGGRPIKLHVYKKPGITHKDIMVYAEDKETMLYYFAYGSHHCRGGRWDMVLHRGGITGPEVLRVTKGNWTDTKVITMADGRETQIKRPKALSSSHDFVGLDGKTKYKWKGKFMRTDLQLFELDDAGEATKGVADWNKTTWTKYKTGSLDINTKFEGELDWIVGTILSIDEWLREVQTVVAVTA